MECAGKGSRSRCLGTATRRCDRCGSVAYCSVSHQISHWSVHKQECERLKQQIKRADQLNDFPFTFTREATYEPTFEMEFLEQVSCGYQTIPQRFLKVVELVNFTSCPADINLARRLLLISPSLERMIVQLKEGMVNIGAAMYRVGTLRRLLPPQAELVILPLDGEDEIATFVKDWSDDEAS